MSAWTEGHGTRTIRFSTDNLGRPLYLTEGRNGMTERPATVAASDELRVRKIAYFAPVSEELLMEYGLIPDTRPAPPPPPWHRRLRWRLTEAVARVRLRLGARIAGVRPEEWEGDGWI